MSTCNRRWTLTIALFALSASLFLGGLPPALADQTFGNNSTIGFTQYSISNGMALFARFTSPSASGTLISITFFVSGGSGFGNAGIYSDSSGFPGSLVGQGTAQSLSSSTSYTFPISGSLSISASTPYWLAFAFTSGSFYFNTAPSPMKRAWILPYTCTSSCTLPSPPGSFTGIDTVATYAVYATYSTGPDFSISANPTSQTIGAGATATSVLTLTSQSSYSGSVGLTVTSGCPTGATCAISTSPVTVPSGGSIQTSLSVQTTGSTSAVSNAQVLVTATDGTLSHTVTFTVTIGGASTFLFNVKALPGSGSAQVVVTVQYSGTGLPPPAATVGIANSTRQFNEAGAVVYDRVLMGSSSQAYTSIHRVTFTIYAGSGGQAAQVWTLYVSGPSTYTVTVEVS